MLLLGSIIVTVLANNNNKIVWLLESQWFTPHASVIDILNKMY